MSYAAHWLAVGWHNLRWVSLLLRAVDFTVHSVCVRQWNVHQGYKEQCLFSLGEAWPMRLFLSTLYHLNLPRITSASGEGEGGLLFNKVTDLQSRLSSPRSSKRSVENMPIELLGHYVDHKILECVWQALTLAGWFAGSRLEGNLKAQTHWWATTYQNLLLCHLPLPASRPKTCTWTHHKIDSWWKTGI